MVGQRLGPYHVLAKLGQGGMGEVFRAHDTRLQRDVALKLLPESLAMDPVSTERFQREARAVAALSHPNIVTIYSVEEIDGRHLLTMELIEGSSLGTLVHAGGLSLDRFLEVAIPLADAVAAAHDRGIVHRDLKPDNVMIDAEGRVKVLDFGLAKLTAAETLAGAETREGLTNAGRPVGTIPYMAPEQIQGRTVDARADVFSLGVMLYELSTGTHPFESNSSLTFAAAILRDTPPPVRNVRPDLPGPLGRLIGRCLEKRPTDRVQTARDVLNELKTLGAESTPPADPPASLPAMHDPPSGAKRAAGMWTAVLPFAARGSDPDASALADGLTKDIRAGLAKFPYLRVAAAPRIARYVVEGSVRRAGPILRVSVELKDVQSGVQLWGGKYDRDIAASSVFAIQDDLAARVIATVGDQNGVLAMSMAAGLRERDVSQLAADELALRFFAFQFNQRPEENAALRGALEAIVARNPSDAMGWACLAAVYRSARLHLETNVQDAVERQFQAAQRAIELDPGSQLGWESLAAAHFFRRDATAFRLAADRAIAINPLNTSIVAILSHLIGYSGEWCRGLELLNRVMSLGTQHPGWFHFLPFVNHFRLGEYEQAWQTANRVNMPDYPWALLSIAASAAELGRWDEARAAVAAMAKSAPQYLSVDVVRAEWRMLLWDEALLERFMNAYTRALRADTAAAGPDASRA